MKKLILVVLAIFTFVVAGCDFTSNTNQTEINTTDTISVVDTTETIEADSLVQCVGITKNGTQCQRMIKYPDTLCFQHIKK